MGSAIYDSAATAFRRVLVIKMGSLGDMVQAFDPFERIRAAHPGAQITLLTTPPYASLAAATPFFDRIETDARPMRPLKTLAMLRRLRRARYDRVYDLQISTRSGAYFYALWPRPPQWSGIAPLCSHPLRVADPLSMHTMERQAEQLMDAGIWPDAPVAPGTAPAPDVSLLFSDDPERQPLHFGLTGPYALLIPGASAPRPGKRWPAQAYAGLAERLMRRGLQVAVVGGPGEVGLAALIKAAAPGVHDLCGRTDYAQVAGLGRHATLAVGNDTGPSHLVAAAGAPTLVLFSAESDPALCAPRGPCVQVLREARLADLSVQRADDALASLVPAQPPHC